MIIFVGGPAGSGKSTVGQGLAHALGLSYIEGDEYHSPANVEKMGRGIPLTDADRWGWLDTLAVEGTRVARERGSCVVSCSALKKAYRDRLRKSAGGAVGFVFLDVDAVELLDRVKRREGHFMKGNMIESQISIMEIPDLLAEPDSIVYLSREDVAGTIRQVVALVSEKWASILS